MNTANWSLTSSAKPAARTGCGWKWHRAWQDKNRSNEPFFWTRSGPVAPGRTSFGHLGDLSSPARGDARLTGCHVAKPKVQSPKSKVWNPLSTGVWLFCPDGGRSDPVVLGQTCLWRESPLADSRSEIGDWKLEIGNWKLEIGRERLTEVGDGSLVFLTLSQMVRASRTWSHQFLDNRGTFPAGLAGALAQHGSSSVPASAPLRGGGGSNPVKPIGQYGGPADGPHSHPDFPAPSGPRFSLQQLRQLAVFALVVVDDLVVMPDAPQGPDDQVNGEDDQGSVEQ